MTDYQKLVIDNFTDLRRINPRETPDLPESIRGEAIWFAPEETPNGHKPPISYHILSEGVYYPIEFVNNAWHFISWDDDKYKGYWVSPKRKLEQGVYNLGWLGRIVESLTPQAVGPSFTSYRERAESASTHPQQPSPSRDNDDDENPIDTQPEETEGISQHLLQQSLLEGIAEEIEPSQPRAHYMPTVVPSAQGLAPVRINPIRARATNPSENISATQGASQLITNAIKIDGQLKGKVPETFDGDRTKAETFMNSFDLFWMTNDENSVMKIPYKRCTYFLGLLGGPKIDDWAFDQTKLLREKVTRNSDPIEKKEESLWEDLKDSFTNSYAHTGRIEQAKIDLNKLEMVGDQIDEYIAKFENLLRKANIPRHEETVKDKFTDGLRKGLHAAILRLTEWPETLDQWEEAARREVRRMAVTKIALGERGNYHLTTRQAKWQMKAQNVLRPKKKDEAVPMEIDAVQMDKTSQSKAAEAARLKKEGRCFKCLKQGHIKRNCPDWKGKTTDKPPPPPYKPKARTATIEVKDDPDTPDEETDNLKDLARRMALLDVQKKEDLFDILMEEPGF